MAYARDLKSLTSNSMRVRLPPKALNLTGDNMPKDEKQIMFETYSEIEEEFEAIKRSTARVVKKRSEIVEKIFNAHGPGPYKWRGVYYTVSKRTNKMTMEDTYFFKSPSTNYIEEI